MHTQSLLLVAAFVAAVACRDWTPATTFLKNAIKDHAFPGCTALVADRNGVLFSTNIGHQTYDSAIPIDDHTLWDMASTTKTLIATTAIAQFYQRDELPLNTRISKLFPSFSANGKGSITIANMLLHNSGIPPVPSPGYMTSEFGCPEMGHYHPQLRFSCTEKIYDAVMNLKLLNPVGTKYMYSDLSMVVLMYVVGAMAKQKQYVSELDVRKECPLGKKGSEQCYFDAYVRKYIFDPLKLQNSMFIVPEKMKSRCAPAWNETEPFYLEVLPKYIVYSHRNELVHGYVSDQTAFALGGISGNAGLFTTIDDVFTLMHDIMFGHKLINETTLSVFTTPFNTSQSTRALGWDTNVNQSAGSQCQYLSKRTFMHTGYTGTEVCADQERGIFVLLLTNRVYPDYHNAKMGPVRNTFSKIVRDIIDST
jgi:CubicO group peptidase (beta-lactamase class C family)